VRRSLAVAIDAQARWLADWLYSRTAYVLLVYGTILWVPLAVLGVDKHGFVYLYVATSLSLVTQVPLAMLGRSAAAEARRSEQVQIETMKLLVALSEKIVKELETQDEVLESIEERVDDLPSALL